MKQIVSVALAAITLAGAGLATATPAAAQEWRGRGDWYEGWRGRDHDRNWRSHGRDWYRGYYSGYRRGCYDEWAWSRYWQRYVRVTRCR